MVARSARASVAARVVARPLTASLRRFLYSKGIPEGHAEELIDMARMQLYEQGLPRTPGEVDRLLFRIVDRRAMDWFREGHGGASPEQELPGEEGFVIERFRKRAPSEPAHASRTTQDALRQLKRLAGRDPRHKRALEAIRQKAAGKSFVRFAAEIGVRAGTLRQWVRRFREYLRELEAREAAAPFPRRRRRRA
jgi:DNA-directed RNA polymerase specialized sigma24 family protein